jgi:hypothetical protein
VAWGPLVGSLRLAVIGLCDGRAAAPSLRCGLPLDGVVGRGNQGQGCAPDPNPWDAFTYRVLLLCGRNAGLERYS